MKRFYAQAEARPVPGGYEIALDGRPVMTPARAPLVVPTAALAEAIRSEWDAQGDKVDPGSMPLTGLANGAIDRIEADRDGFIRGLSVFGETDLLCYRAEGPLPLVALQGAAWDPLLDWARRRYDCDFEVISGIMHRHQPADSVAKLAGAVAAYDSFRLVALSVLVTISGSLVVALALAEGDLDLEAAWTAATVDEEWQSQNWGQDAEAARSLDRRRREFDAAFRFLTLLA